MKFARIVNNQAVDVRTESPVDAFTSEIAALFVEVPDEVEDHWQFVDGAWKAPIIPDIPASVIPEPEPPKVSPVEFKLLFTSLERVAIKSARQSDTVLDDFYDIVEDSRLTFVDLGLSSTKDALTYMVSKGLLTDERKAEILTGKMM